MNEHYTEVLTPVGRIVAGNPLEVRQVLDYKTGQPKLTIAGEPRVETYFGLAIVKGTESAWWETPWGADILAAGQRDWPRGETQNPLFAWKITDGDSTVPNKRGKRPCDQEGYPGHWVLNCSTGLAIRCYRTGQYEPHQILQPAAKEIKTGDYGRATLNVRGNGPDVETPGVYLNPQIFELVQAGPAIITQGGPDPHEAFATAPTMPAGALPDPGTGAVPPAAGAVPPAAGAVPPAAGAVPPAAGAVPPGTGAPSMPPPTVQPSASTVPPATGAAAPPGAVQPAPDFLAPDAKRIDSAGNVVTVAAMRQAGWSDDQIRAAPEAQ